MEIISHERNGGLERECCAAVPRVFNENHVQALLTSGHVPDSWCLYVLAGMIIIATITNLPQGRQAELQLEVIEH